jgi:hypothetical protein
LSGAVRLTEESGEVGILIANEVGVLTKTLVLLAGTRGMDVYMWHPGRLLSGTHLETYEENTRRE